MLTDPAACGGVTAEIVVLLTTLTPVAAVPPTLTDAPAAKLVPVIVTVVPPGVGPAAGDTLPTVGAGAEAVYVKLAASVALCASAFVTVTFTVPAACAGVVAVIVVLLSTVTLPAGLPPTLTVAPAAKFAPEMVTAVPPLVGPEGGAMLVTVGAAPRYVNAFARVPICASVLVTVTATAPAG
jgi:hypothetical protein